MTCSAARSASVTGSNEASPALFSTSTPWLNRATVSRRAREASSRAKATNSAM